MRHVEFTLKIPIPGTIDQFEELVFNSPKEICQKINISEGTLYAICNGKIKFSHSKNQHLSGIIIQKKTVYAAEKNLEKLKNNQKNQQELIKKKLEENKLLEEEKKRQDLKKKQERRQELQEHFFKTIIASN